MDGIVIIECQLSRSRAWAFAQLLKRLGFSDCQALAEDKDQAYEMIQAAEQVRRALAEAGIAPR